MSYTKQDLITPCEYIARVAHVFRFSVLWFLICLRPVFCAECSLCFWNFTSSVYSFIYWTLQGKHNLLNSDDMTVALIMTHKTTRPVRVHSALIRYILQYYESSLSYIFSLQTTKPQHYQCPLISSFSEVVIVIYIHTLKCFFCFRHVNLQFFDMFYLS